MNRFKIRVAALVISTAYLLPLYQNCSPQHILNTSASGLSVDQGIYSSPEISLAGIPDLVSSSNSVTFGLSYNKAVTIKSVQCQIDALAVVDCSSKSISLAGLSDGDHNLKIMVETQTGVKAEAQKSIRKDSTPPVLSLAQTPPATTASLSTTISFSAQDALSGVSKLECSYNGAAYSQCASPVNVSVPGMGAYTYQIRAIDGAGNSSVSNLISWTVDTSVPTVSLTQTPSLASMSDTAQFSFSGMNVTSFECQMDTAAYEVCASPKQYSALSSASHTFRVRGKSSSGALSAVATYTWVVDKSAPSVPTISNASSPYSKQKNASLSFNSSDVGSGVASYQCSLDGSAFSACVSPFSAPNLADGNHTFSVKAIDAVGNTSSAATSTWGVDSVIPTLSITPNSNQASTVQIAFIAADASPSSGLSTQCSRDGGAFSSCTSPVSFSGLTAGEHTMTVRAFDAAGNSINQVYNWISADLATGKMLYSQYCVECHGELNVTEIPNKTVTQINTALSTVSEMIEKALKSKLNQGQVASIALALKTTTTDDSGRLTYICDPNQMAPTPILRLSHRELLNSVHNILDGFSTTLKSDSELSTLYSAIPSDLLRELHLYKEQNFLFTSAMTSAYFDLAFRAGALVASSSSGLQNYPNTSGCLASATLTQACHQSFVKELATRAFRRPLSTSEITSLNSTLWNSSLGKSSLIQLTVASILQMPDFMYRIFDQGTVTNLGPTTLKLSAYEYANKISYFLTGLPPDSALQVVAANGTILDPSVAAIHVDRLLATPAAEVIIKRMFRESYGYDYYDGFLYSSQFLNGQSTTGIKEAMTEEMDQFFVDISLKQKLSFKDLMTSRRAIVNNANLAQIYGVSPSAAITTLPPERAGFLSRASFLAKRSGNYNSPVQRGLNIMENVICEKVGVPPPNAPGAVETSPAGNYLTTRDRYYNKTEQTGTACIICHTRINNLGYALENFDSIGRLRTQERIFDNNSGDQVATLSVNSTTTTQELNGSPVTLAGSQGLGAALGDSDKALMCFVKHIKQFESRRLSVPEDSCQMNQILKVVYGSNGNQGTIVNAFKEMVLSTHFMHYKY